jgi:lambda family phage portal protein
MAKINIIDRAIGMISPRAGVRRLAHRAALAQAERAYAGADRGRLRKGWRTRSTSADNEIAKDGQLLRDRMRDLVRNNALAANAIDILVTHAIGDGIVPKFKDRAVQDAFDRWAKRSDAAGELDFGGIQALAAREMFEGGEGLVRRVRRPYGKGRDVPLALQVLEADQIDATKDVAFAGRANLVQGIELDELGAKTAFHLFDHHPGNSPLGGSGFKSVRVPASEIAHLLEKQRTQVRGVPWGAPVITDLHELNEYKDAERVRKKIEACLVGVMTGGEDGDMLGLESSTDQPAGIYDAKGQRVERFAPGMLYQAVGGRDVKFLQPTASGDYAEYTETEEHWIAAGFRLPHFVLTGRLDKVNYSSSKVGLEVFKRMISRLQWHTIIPLMLEPIMRWWIEAAYLAGIIADPAPAYNWVPPRFYSADPIKDLKAQQGEVRSGFRAWQDVVTERGENADELADRLAEDAKRFDDKGLVLDIDPRRLSQAGQVQDKGETHQKDDEE